MNSDREALEGQFERYDRDGDGRLDFDEFSHLLTRLGVRRSGELMRSLFERIDRDDNGTISLSEFSAWWSEAEGDAARPGT